MPGTARASAQPVNQQRFDTIRAAVKPTMDRVSRPDSLCYPMARDGELVVMHDPDVPRTTDGHGHVKDMTLTEIKSLDASIRWAPQYQGERVPTLAEVLAWARSASSWSSRSRATRWSIWESTPSA